MIGQDAVNTAQAVRRGSSYDGVVLTKLDGDARGGAALSIAVTGKPIKFASAGETLDDFEAFHPERHGVAHPRHGRHRRRLMQAEKVVDAEKAEKAAASSSTAASFTLDDFLEQMQQSARWAR